MGGRDAGGGGDDAAARALRESRGTRFFAVNDNGEREVKAAKTRGRWERLVAAARALGAHAVECRDDDGATVAVVELDDREERSERTERDDRVGEVERLLALVVRAQDQAVARQAEQVRAVTDAAMRVMHAAADRASAMERAVLAMVRAREADLARAAEELDVAARAVERAAAERGERADETSELDAMATTLVRDAVAPVLMQRLAGAPGNKGAA